jgi:uncharacterized protein YjbJ (UPF0337 family)
MAFSHAYEQSARSAKSGFKSVIGLLETYYKKTGENHMKPSTKDKTEGKLHEVKGKIKEEAGKVTNDPNLEVSGKAEKKAGKVQKWIGRAEKAVGE